MDAVTPWARVGMHISALTTMPLPLDRCTARLMLAFSRLSPRGQKRFLESLNTYMFAAPKQREKLCDAWRRSGGAPAGEKDEGSALVPFDEPAER